VTGFLTGLTERTKGVWARLTAMFPAGRERGVLDADAHSVFHHRARPGSLDGDAEIIVGLQAVRR